MTEPQDKVTDASPRMTISADMLAVLTSEHGNRESIGAQWSGDGFRVSRGNVAASAYNATQGGGLEGINLGWRGQEESTDFLCRIVSDVDELWDEMNVADEEGNIYGNVVHAWRLMCDNGRDHEIADSCVPIYTRTAVLAALRLNAEVEDHGLLPDEPTMGDFARVALYELALSIVYGLVEALIANAETTVAS